MALKAIGARTEERAHAQAAPARRRLTLREGRAVVRPLARRRRPWWKLARRFYSDRRRRVTRSHPPKTVQSIIRVHPLQFKLDQRNSKGPNELVTGSTATSDKPLAWASVPE